MASPVNLRSFRAPDAAQEVASITDMAKSAQVRLRVAQHLDRVSDGVDMPKASKPSAGEKSSYGST